MVGRLAVALALLAAAAACGAEDSLCDRYPGGRFDLSRLVIREDTHPGPLDAACASCHPYALIHRANCTELSTVDMVEVQNMVETQGSDSCARCHLPRKDPQ